MTIRGQDDVAAGNLGWWWGVGGAALLAGGFHVMRDAGHDAGQADGARPRVASAAAGAMALPRPVGGRIAPAAATRRPGAAAHPSAAWRPVAADASAFELVKVGIHQDADPESGALYDYMSVAIGDVTGDGRDDLVALLNTNVIEVFVQRADGTVPTTPDRWVYHDNNSTHSAKELVLADFNEDGVLDVASSGINPNYTGNQGTVNMLLSDGRGGLVFKRQLDDIMYSAQGWVVQDMDRDGHLDIIGFEHFWDYSTDNHTCGGADSCPMYRVMYGDGMGGIEKVESFAIPMDYTLSSSGNPDLNGDGLPDLTYTLEGTPYKQGRAFVRYQLPHGGLSAAKELHVSHDMSGSLVYGDFNNDGRPDSLTMMAWFAEPPSMRYQTASGGFAAPVPIPSALRRSNWPNIADFDGDGAVDLVAVQMSNSMVGLATYLQRNGSLASPTFSNYSGYELDKVATGRYALASGDLNSDGCRDLVVAANYEGLQFYRGSGCRIVQRVPVTCRFKERLPGLLPAAVDAGTVSRLGRTAPFRSRGAQP